MTTRTKLEQLRQIQELEHQLKLKVALKMQRKKTKHLAARQLTEQLQKELKVSQTFPITYCHVMAPILYHNLHGGLLSSISHFIRKNAASLKDGLM